MIKKILIVSGNILLILLIFLGVCGLLLAIKSKKAPRQVHYVFNLTPMIVLSGSMQPNINTGDIIICKKVYPGYIGAGDVITYKDQSGGMVTHRVIQKIDKNNEILFKTRGDANNVDDERLVLSNQLVGVEVFKIPYGGYVSNFLKSKIGFILLIITPLMALIISNTISMLSEKGQA